MREYRKLSIEEAERISEIDATNYIKNVWRIKEDTGEWRWQKLIFDVCKTSKGIWC